METEKEYANWVVDCEEIIKKLKKRYDELERANDFDSFENKTIQNIKKFCTSIVNDTEWYDKYLKNNYQKIKNETTEIKNKMSNFLESSWKTYKNIKTYTEDVFSDYKKKMTECCGKTGAKKQKTQLKELNKKFSDALIATTKSVKSAITNIKTYLAGLGVVMPSTMKHLIWRGNTNPKYNNAKIGVLDLVAMSLNVMEHVDYSNESESEEKLKKYIERFKTAFIHCAGSDSNFELLKMKETLSETILPNNDSLVCYLDEYVKKTKKDIENELVPRYKTFVKKMNEKIAKYNGKKSKNPFDSKEFKVITSYLREKTKEICEKNIKAFKDEMNDSYANFKEIATEISKILPIQVMCDHKIIRFTEQKYDITGNAINMGVLMGGCVALTAAVTSLILLYASFAFSFSGWTNLGLFILGIAGSVAAIPIGIIAGVTGGAIAYGVNKYNKTKIEKNFEDEVAEDKVKNNKISN